MGFTFAFAVEFDEPKFRGEASEMGSSLKEFVIRNSPKYKIKSLPRPIIATKIVRKKPTIPD